jgi:hypothetical protein
MMFIRNYIWRLAFIFLLLSGSCNFIYEKPTKVKKAYSAFVIFLSDTGRLFYEKPLEVKVAHFDGANWIIELNYPVAVESLGVEKAYDPNHPDEHAEMWRMRCIDKKQLWEPRERSETCLDKKFDKIIYGVPPDGYETSVEPKPLVKGEKYYVSCRYRSNRRFGDYIIAW